MSSGEQSTAGASARREYDRRRANDEAKIRDRWGRLGGVAVALTDERRSTAVWKTGARDEEVVGAHLESLARADAAIRVLHDRRLPRSRANIDHLVVTPAGVVVIDAKRYVGRPERRVESGLFRPGVEKLVVKGRDKTPLVDAVLGQVDRVRDALGDVRVRAVLCFVDADWPLFGGGFSIRGVAVCWPKRLQRVLAAAAPSDAPLDVDAVAGRIAARFPPA